MTTNQDARPFSDLKKDAEEFRMKFDEDIAECLNFLDAKIKTLICDPDSIAIPGRSIHQNALAEFSKAKYDIFVGVQSFINAKEREWLSYIAEMKKLFIENVEIYLAGTKLEVKLPASESMPSRGSRKSPGNCKSNSASVTSSIYPIISSITKNIPVLGSSFHEKDVQSIAPKAFVREKDQFNRRGRLSTSSVKLPTSIYFEEMDFEEPESDILDRSRSRSSSGNRSRHTSLNTSRSSLERRSSLKKEKELAVVQNYMISSDENESQSTEIAVKEVPLKGRRGRIIPIAKTNNLPVVAKNSNSNTDEDENQVTEAIDSEVTLKGRRGKYALKGKLGVFSVVKNNSNEAENHNDIREDEVPIKGRRGKSASKAKINELSVVKNSSSTDENENETTETNDNKVPLKGRRGRSAPKTKVNDLTDQTLIKKTLARGRKTVQEAIHEDMYEPDQTHIKKTSARGRKTVQQTIDEEIYEPGPSNSPKKVSFDGDHSSSDELDIQTPLARPVKSAARRKTLLPNLEHLSGVDIIPGNSSRPKAKRKTISNASELESMAPSKRLKVSQKAISVQEEDSANDNLLESDGNYSEWMSLKSIDGKIPTRPAIYEMKVWRAKKPAYIGSCENLRQKLTFYNLKQNSGHKQLDKFIDRNYNEIQVRYEVIPSFDDAKKEVKTRIESFKAQHKNPPAYN